MILVLILAAVIIVIVYFYFFQRKQRHTGHTAYQEALIALLEQKEDVAIKKFIEAVQVDSDLIDAYIRLGDLYRKKGDISKAIQIHQSLTVRALLKKQVEKEVYYALVRDFLTINRPSKALAYLKEILNTDKKDQPARNMMLTIYEDMEDYASCIGVYEDREFKPKDENRLAFYYASLANSKLNNVPAPDAETEKDVATLFKKALKLAPTSLTTLYYLAHYLEKKEDLKKAKEHYLKIIAHHPHHLFLILPRFEKVYYEVGLFDEIIPTYEKIFDKSMENFSVGFALANLYKKKNDIDSAKHVYRRIADKHPKTILPRIYLLKLMADGKSLKEEISDIEKSISHNQYRCKSCGYETEKFSFICKKCHAIESFLPYL